MIELLIVVTIIPIIIGSISAGLFTILTLQSSVQHRITDSSDAQVLSSTFLKDVQSATKMTTSPSSANQCGSPTGGTLLLGLQWDVVGGIPLTVVSYYSVPVTGGTTTTYSLVREYCTSGNTTTPSSTSTVAFDISGSQFPPCLGTVACTPCKPNGITCIAPGWTPAATVRSVKFVVNEAGSGFAYTLLAYSRAWTPAYVAGIGVFPVFSPLTALTTCSGCTGLSLGNYSSITVNQSLGTNGSSVAIASPFANSVLFGSSDTTLSATTLLTADPNLNSASTSPPPEYYSPVTDPLNGVLTVPPSPSTSGTCSSTTQNNVTTYTCPPGFSYSSSALNSFNSGSTVNFGGGGGATVFPNTFTIPSGVTTNFNSGTYVFDGSPAISPPTSGNATITGNNVFFYIPPSSSNGSVNFGSTSSVYLQPFNSGYDGVTIWDAATTSSTVVNINNIQNNRNSYGGIYVPEGTVNATSSEAAANTALSVMFLIANNITVQQYTNVNVTGP